MVIFLITYVEEKYVRAFLTDQIFQFRQVLPVRPGQNLVEHLAAPP